MLLLPSPKSLTFTDGNVSIPTPVAATTLTPFAPRNGYTLSITSEGIRIDAADEASAFYARTTLQQILTQFPSSHVPCLEIEDWPDLEVRGYMLDISRCKVPTQKSLFELIDLLASLKYNQIQLYTEHTFAYRDHHRVWQEASPLSPTDIKELDAYCAKRFIELVPNQNSFGHMERWLRHPAYHHLAESPGGFEHPISGWKPFGSTLKPNAESAEFVDRLFSELLPNFRSRQLNVGGDEPWELGQGFSKSEVTKRGKTRLYLDHLLRIQSKVHAHGCTMQFWGDIIINQPELASELGPDVTALLWGYEVDHPFTEHCQAMQAAGAKFLVVPGTSSWNSIGGRLYTALPNIDQAADNAKRFSAKGLLLTDWGDNGHQQSHLLSIPPILQAAEKSWNTDSPSVSIKEAAMQLIPTPLSESEYETIFQLSSIAGSFSKYLHNQSWLSKILFARGEQFAETAQQLRNDEVDQAKNRLASFETNGELELARKFLLYAAQKGSSLLNQKTPDSIPPEYLEAFSKFWLARNRPGGLEESLSHFPTN
ncbi:family 20 glycosylhydrolase [Pelagicoccus sp. SDUM812002]|uniref:beta-N-acetylhexosaminidase n=1 Tax=Pelagicoccus sp. SDUM812002 TaxID=3041266 RepID=UPI00280D5B32|nr:family 20 glycosylhydrolase [Pelagicoccus sp. SDUM812002]MDQ8188136.1 family 20 glycosylhydrolase [Pelagicoccus sp. SDUM812002]